MSFKISIKNIGNRNSFKRVHVLDPTSKCGTISTSTSVTENSTKTNVEKTITDQYREAIRSKQQLWREWQAAEKKATELRDRLSKNEIKNIEEDLRVESSRLLSTQPEVREESNNNLLNKQQDSIWLVVPDFYPFVMDEDDMLGVVLFGKRGRAITRYIVNKPAMLFILLISFNAACGPYMLALFGLLPKQYMLSTILCFPLPILMLLTFNTNILRELLQTFQFWFCMLNLIGVICLFILMFAYDWLLVCCFIPAAGATFLAYLVVFFFDAFPPQIARYLVIPVCLTCFGVTAIYTLSVIFSGFPDLQDFDIRISVIHTTASSMLAQCLGNLLVFSVRNLFCAIFVQQALVLVSSYVTTQRVKREDVTTIKDAYYQLFLKGHQNNERQGQYLHHQQEQKQEQLHEQKQQEHAAKSALDESKGNMNAADMVYEFTGCREV